MIVVPVYLLIPRLDLLDTRLGLIIVYSAFNVTLVVWMMESFFREIPVDLEEAAMVDGDSRLTAFRRIVLPLAAPGLVATAIFATIVTYNEFLFALVADLDPDRPDDAGRRGHADRPDQHRLGVDERRRGDRRAADRDLRRGGAAAPGARADDGGRQVGSGRCGPQHPARHLLAAKDLIDARYFEPLGVGELAEAARLSEAHFSREFRRAFGESPHQYLLTRRLERAAALLRTTDRSVADICMTVGLRSVGSFTTSFGRAYGQTPTEYRAAYPPARNRAMIPTCLQLAHARPKVQQVWRRQAARRLLNVVSVSPDRLQRRQR